VVILEGGIAELESELARLLSKPLPDRVTDPSEREALAAYDAGEAAEARRRAQRAQDRAASAALDDHQQRATTPGEAAKQQ